MDKEELKVYEKAVKDKYKHHKVWKILAIFFMCTTFVLSILYFGSGDLFKETINNEVEIINEGDGGNSNNVTINN
jgi:preprotein translocase subunit SecG